MLVFWYYTLRDSQSWKFFPFLSFSFSGCEYHKPKQIKFPRRKNLFLLIQKIITLCFYAWLNSFRLNITNDFSLAFYFKVSLGKYQDRPTNLHTCLTKRFSLHNNKVPLKIRVLNVHSLAGNYSIYRMNHTQ